MLIYIHNPRSYYPIIADKRCTISSRSFLSRICDSPTALQLSCSLAAKNKPSGERLPICVGGVDLSARPIDCWFMQPPFDGGPVPFAQKMNEPGHHVHVLDNNNPSEWSGNMYIHTINLPTVQR